MHVKESNFFFFAFTSTIEIAVLPGAPAGLFPWPPTTRLPRQYTSSTESAREYVCSQVREKAEKKCLPLLGYQLELPSSRPHILEAEHPKQKKTRERQASHTCK